MKTTLKIGGKSYQVEAQKVKENVVKISIEDREYFFSKNEFGEVVSVDSETALKNGDSESQEEVYKETDSKEIRAPINGVVSNIEVKEGSKVSSGQKVATLMAMKMENEVVAENGGKIKKIKVKKDQSVNSGDVLMLLE